MKKIILVFFALTIFKSYTQKPITIIKTGKVLDLRDSKVRKTDEIKIVDCCKESIWGKRTYTLNKAIKSLPDKIEANLGTFQCKEKTDFRVCYNCTAGCNKAIIEYQVYRYGTMNFISKSSVKSCGNYSVTMPSAAGYYGININAYCDKRLCKSLTYYFNVDCKNSRDSIILVSPSPYCPSNTNTPKFIWMDSLKNERKYNYTLKVVEMNIGDTRLSEFDKRKTLFEIRNIKSSNIKFPEKIERLKMGKLYAYKVQKYYQEELVAQSEIFPFIVVDPNLPFINEMLCCQSNLLQNGAFTDGVVNGVLDEMGKANSWKTTYGKPIVVKSDDGCGEPNYFNISGSAKRGSSITQPVKLQKGKHYRLTACVRLCKETKLDYAFVNAVAYNGTLPTNGLHPLPNKSVAKMGWSGRIKAKSWVTFTMPVFSSTIDFEKIAIYCTSENEEMVSLDIDKICLQETNDSLSCDDFQYSENGSLIIPSALANADIRNRDTTYYEDKRGRLTDLYSNYNGTTSFYQTDDPCSSIGGSIPDEVLNVNMNDSLMNMGIKGGIAELDSILNNIIQDTDKPTTLKPIAPPNVDCEQSYKPDPSQPFSGRDIIFVHGLNLSHLCERASGEQGAQRNWPDDASEFYGSGYYKQKAIDGWSDHIKEWLMLRGAKNRYLIVAYNCSQRADVAAHAILTQISDAMSSNGTGVELLDDKRGRECFGKDAVIISHSTGALVTDIAMAIAEKSKNDPIVQARFGNVGYISNSIKVHLAPNGAFRGSKMATVFLASQSALDINSPITKMTACGDYPFLDPLKMSTTAYQSILIDLQPAVATALWMPLINAFNKTTTITLAGGHSIGTYEMEDYPLVNIALHPGFDDGVLTMGSQSANPWLETGPFPVGYNRKPGVYKLYDMGIAYQSIPRANRYFYHQSLFTPPPFVGGASTPYLSPTGMRQPVLNVPPLTNPENRMPNHYSFLQSASDHYLGTRGRSNKEGYNTTNHNFSSGFRLYNYNYYDGGDKFNNGKHWEESLVITNPSLFTNGFINPSVINLPEEVVRGEYVDWEVWGPKFRFRKPFQIDIIWDLLFHIRFTIWERKYHLMSDTETECQMSYMYKYILR